MMGVLARLEQEIHKNGDQFRILPIGYLERLKEDVFQIANNEYSNEFTKWIAANCYELELPKLDFEVRSVIIAASPSPLVRVLFHLNDKDYPLMMPPTYVDMNSAPKKIERYLNDCLNPYGFHVRHENKLSHKVLAVRSGLCRYGRNNITYAEGFGSFHRLAAFYSDVPCDEAEWYGLGPMESCAACQLCLKNCPTNAISEDRYQIDATRCLTGFNEFPGEAFPEWIDAAAHNCIVGCMKCQELCPHNKAFLNAVAEPVEFTEHETRYLLGGGDLDSAPEEFRRKVKTLGMEIFYGVLARNLKALLYR